MTNPIEDDLNLVLGYIANTNSGIITDISCDITKSNIQTHLYNNNM
jgi:hypothetical protein